MSEAIQAITMPKWGLAMEEGMVAAWLAEEGSTISAGQEVMEIETSKITNVYESPVGGTLRRRIVGEGETVPVGALLGLVAESDVSDADLDAYVEEFNANFAVQAAEAGDSAPEPETIEAGGHSLNYLRLGTGEGTPIVLLHGFGGDLNNWLFNQPALAEQHDVIALDLPGHGRSSKDVGGGDMAMLRGALGAFLDALEIERAHLVGHSMGGALSLAFALDHPDRVAALTLVAPAGLGPEINMDYIEGFIGAGKRKEMKTALQLLVADAELISRDMVNDVLKYKRLDGVEAGLRRLADGLFPDGRQQTLDGGALGGLGMPIVVAWGEADQILPIGHADALPGSAKVERLSGIGHLPHMEAAAEVNRLIEETLG